MGLREDDVEYEVPPKHVKNEQGRIFVATPTLLARKDMTPVFDYKPEVAGQSKADKPEQVDFNLKKATKQQIVTKALADYGAELSMDLKATELREKFKELMDASDNDS